MSSSTGSVTIQGQSAFMGHPKNVERGRLNKERPR